MNVLIFTGGLHPKKTDFESFIATCDAIDLVIAADSGFDTAQLFGIECDLIIGDMDSIVYKDLLQNYPKEKIITFPKDKDYTDTQLALFESHKRGATHITLIGGDGGRLDHTMALLKVFEGSVYPNTWLCKDQIVFFLDEKTPVKKINSRSSDTTISVFCVGCDGKIVSDGLKWNLETVNWKNGEYSLSNRALGSNVSIKLTVQKGRFLTIVPYNF